MAQHPLSSSTLLGLLEASIGSSEQPRPASTQTLRNPYDAIALLVHVCMLSVGFRLIGLDEDDKLDSPIDGSTNLRPPPQKWNSGSSYGFRYAHSQSSLEFLIKISRLGAKVVVFGLGVGDEKTASFDIVTKDFTSETFFPYTPGDDEGEEETGGSRRRVRDGFISESRIADLASLVKINIIQKLVPGLNKPGYQEDRSETSSASSSSRVQRPHERRDVQQNYNDPLRVWFPPRPYQPGPPPIPAGEGPPGFEDEYEILQPPRRGGPMAPGRNPLSVGEDDLNPPGLGPNPALRGPFFGEGGLPRPGFGGVGPMGGMHPTPDHPMFGGVGNGGEGNYDPRFPPGSRYDPVGPGDAPRGGLRFPGRGGGGFGGFGGFGSGDFI